MSKLKDLTGQKFGYLLVLERVKNRNNRVWWKCLCDCGNLKEVASSRLVNGNTISCGCQQFVNFKKSRITHNLSNTKLYKVWHHMKERCYLKTDKRYKNYGGRGIKICDEWKNDFINFYNWAINNGYQENLTIDRINVNGNYTPLNCRWVTWKEQANNTTRNHYIEYNGEKHTISEWADLLNISSKTLQIRLKRGWSIEDTIKIKKGGRRNETT